jgi:hypothetical protein
MFSRYGSHRFRQIVSEIGVFSAVRYSLEHLMDIAANVAAEFVSGLKNQRTDNTISYSDFCVAKDRDDYYRGRWNYLTRVIKLVEEESPEKVLELGPRSLPVVKGSDTMDFQSHGQKLTYMHDAKTIPWPVEDKKYDMFIALQVWEHLDGRQKEAFREVMRTSRTAILSFPYKRHFPGDCHHGIDEEKIEEWTIGSVPEKVTRVGPAIIYFFRF